LAAQHQEREQQVGDVGNGVALQLDHDRTEADLEQPKEWRQEYCPSR
jgi:hypothetical protein